MCESEKAAREPVPPGEAQEKGGIVARLHAALDKKLCEIENRIEAASQSGAGSVSPAVSERDARTLTALARLYEKLVELDKAASRKPKSGVQTGKDTDAPRFREEIASRLERMLEAEEA